MGDQRCQAGRHGLTATFLRGLSDQDGILGR